MLPGTRPSPAPLPLPRPPPPPPPPNWPSPLHAHPLPSRRDAAHATLALVRGARRASGSAWEAAARPLVVTHRGAPRPPRAWLAAERAAASVGPRAAMAGLLSEEEVAVAPIRVVLAGEGRAAPAAAVPAPGVGVGAGVAPPSPSPSPPPTPTPAPSFCHLAPHPTGRRFADPAVAAYLDALFACIPLLRREAGLPAVELSRWDLFHAHLFWAAAAAPANARKHGRHPPSRASSSSSSPSPGHFGLLFHCFEYPARSPGAFDLDLGHCQAGSPLAWTAQAGDWRNVVMVGGRLASLGCEPGGALGAGLLWPALAGVRTVVEADLGWAGLDVTWFGDGGGGGDGEGGGGGDRVLAYWVGGGGG